MVDICYPAGTDWGCVFSEEEVEGLDPIVKERAEALAWSTLAALTGYRLSLCPVTIRPCASRCNMQTWYVAPVGSGNFAGAPPGSAFSPYVSNGVWFNACGCTTPGDCSCSALCEVILPSTVGGIESVWMDGVELEKSSFRVDNGNRLIRLDGECFPACQDMTINDPTEGGLWVSYYPGVAPNDLFRYAAGVLATEFYKACSGRDCRLPSGVTNISRAGISMEISPGTFPGGMTGIPEVDAVIRVYNPYALKSPPRVLSPDRRVGRIPTWG
ncbi:MAG TPA: hypothetical protein VIY86_06180 [Pirellulaceae bacterium]